MNWPTLIIAFIVGAMFGANATIAQWFPAGWAISLEETKAGLEKLYWFGGAILALIAVISLNQRSAQARATFLLHLDQQWTTLSSTRQKMFVLRQALTADVMKKTSEYEDKHRLAALREAGKVHIDKVKEDTPELYFELLQYLCFFELVGLMVRNGYVPLRDMVRLYKGPILDVDFLFRLHIDEWQKMANTPEGLLENVIYLTNRTQRHERLRKRLLFWK